MDMMSCSLKWSIEEEGTEGCSSIGQEDSQKGQLRGAEGTDLVVGVAFRGPFPIGLIGGVISNRVC